jgi:hypothetical protein
MARDESRHLLVMRFLDGEVSEQEAEAATNILNTDVVFSREMRAVHGLGALLRQQAHAKARAVDFSRFADNVLRQAESRKPVGLWERFEAYLRETLGQASQLWLPAAVVSAAAAAAILLSHPKTWDGNMNGQRNELVITKVDTDKNWMSQTIDDQGTTIIWIDDSGE